MQINLITPLITPNSLRWYLVQHVLLLGIVQLIYQHLPSARNPNVEPTPPPNNNPQFPQTSSDQQFSAFSALELVQGLADLGPRVTGSTANEFQAVSLLNSSLRDVQKTSKWPVRIDHQVGDGNYHWDSVNGVTFQYQGLQNLVARISFGNEPSEKAVLLNCHFDSVPLSPGASDDAVSCGIMLEILRSLSQMKTRLHHDVIFLFNGAEEAALAASHLFITQHKWARDIELFVNLEAAGAGGREILFQSGPGNTWILEVYLKYAPYPSTSVAGQEIFQGGLIPSDTDFRIFRDFGNLSGLDIAFIKNGYVYHTRYDTTDRIPLGSIQRAGVNILTVTKFLANMTDFPNYDRDETSPVFFEMLGFFTISYSERTAIFINSFCCFLAILHVLKKVRNLSKKTDIQPLFVLKTLAILLGLRVVSLIVSLTFVVVLSSFLQMLNLSMSWYSNIPLMVPLYVLPYVSITVHFFDYASRTLKKKNPFLKDLSFDSVQMEFVLYTLIGTLLGIRSIYIATLCLIFPLLESILRGFLEEKWKEKLDTWTPMLNPLYLVPLINLMYLTTIVISIFVPIMGRRGSNLNPDFLIGPMAVVLGHITLAYLTPKTAKCNDLTETKKQLSLMWLAAIFIVCLTPYAFPYNSDYNNIAPQRLLVQHASRTHINSKGDVTFKDSGISIEKMDFYEPKVFEYQVMDFKSRKTFEDCRNASQLNCGLPFYSSNLSKKKKMYWIDYPNPKISDENKVSLTVLKREVSKKGTRLSLSLTGPTAIKMVISPSTSLNLTSWSLTDEVKEANYKWNNRNTYSLVFIRGVTKKQHKFWLDFDIIDNGEEHETDRDVKIVMTGQIHHEPGRIQTEFRYFLDTFPDWTFPWAWTVDYVQQEISL